MVKKRWIWRQNKNTAHSSWTPLTSLYISTALLYVLFTVHISCSWWKCCGILLLNSLLWYIFFFVIAAVMVSLLFVWVVFLFLFKIHETQCIQFRELKQLLFHSRFSQITQPIGIKYQVSDIYRLVAYKTISHTR